MKSKVTNKISKLTFRGPRGGFLSFPSLPWPSPALQHTKVAYAGGQVTSRAVLRNLQFGEGFLLLEDTND